MTAKVDIPYGNFIRLLKNPSSTFVLGFNIFLIDKNGFYNRKKDSSKLVVSKESEISFKLLLLLLL